MNRPVQSNPAVVLIAEDSRTQAAQLQHLLETRGYTVLAASDGSAALAVARRQKPDLVITDVDMPLMDGYVMCRALKQDADLWDVPIILLTSMNDLEDVVRGLEAGADYYLTKPYQADYLLSRVGEILADPRPEKPSAAPDPIAFVLNGKPRVLHVDRRQMLTLLLSTYSDAVQRNRELLQSQRLLNRQNELLDAAARSQRAANEALKEAQSQLIQSEKMVGLGQLVAGIAHEINNPLAFVTNNMAVIHRDLALIQQVMELYRKAESGLAARADLLEPITQLAEKIDLPLTLENLNEMLDSSLDGLRRMSQIVLDLRDFVRLDDTSLKEADINAGIESTVNIIRSKATDHHVQIELDLHPLPPVTCYPAKINQVVMNLVANAIDASPEGEKVTVHTRPESDAIRIDVLDRGCGVPLAIRDKIFDPFFTTKPPGKGTGLGLSISYGIVRDHGGRIETESPVGQGARFTVYLPVAPQESHPTPSPANP